ncbi:MAG: hypothetical protein U0527_12565 [Candidatus Eisenbacteria bacterium]
MFRSVGARNSSSILRGALLCATLGVVLWAAPAAADRKYFVETYTPYLAGEGKLEYESWLTSKSGKPSPDTRTAWDLRSELECGLSERLTGALYLNFSQEAGGALRFVSPSLELIYAPVEPGRLPVDPAFYLEVSESGEELELEPKLLLGRRVDRWVAAANLVSELAFRHNDDEREEDGEVIEREWEPAVSAGLAYEFSSIASLALEARYVAEYVNMEEKEASMFSLGPTLNLQKGSVQLSLGILPQISGSPATSGHLNLSEFERTRVRMILGIDL